MGIFDSGDFPFINNSGVFVQGNNNSVDIKDSTFEGANNYDFSQDLTSDEWQTLEWYFIECQAMFAKQTEYYKACTDILHTIEKRDAPSVKNVLKKIGASVINVIMSAGAEIAMSGAVRIVLDKIKMG